MKPLAIISSDGNPNYLSLLPIVCKSWELQGFDTLPIVLITDYQQVDRTRDFLERWMACKPQIWYPRMDVQSRLNPSLYVQCIRLYAGGKQKDDRYCIVSDADMFIASPFLYRDFDKVNCFGHDLTGFNEIPICYVGMNSQKWSEVMGEDYDQILHDLKDYGKPDSDVWHEAWGCDQQILTEKLKNYGFDKINFISRGTDPNNQGLPLGRWDRYGGFKKPAVQVNDVHLMRDPLSDENFPKIMGMCKALYPAENWDWLIDYRNDFLNFIACK
jgi:hypothetical protein